MDKKKNLCQTHPEIVKEWNYSKKQIDPEEVTAGSQKRVRWICSKGHEWISNDEYYSIYDQKTLSIILEQIEIIN